MALVANRRAFYIDSRMRINQNDSHSDFTYQIELPKGEVFDRVVVLSAKIPKSYYLVQNGYNTFTLQELTTNTIVTVPVGCYSLTSFKTVIQNLLNSSSAYGWTYALSTPNTSSNPSTGLITFTVTNNTGQPSFIFTSSSLCEQFGFEKSSTNTFVNSSLTSIDVVNFQLEDTLFIHSDISTNGQDDILQEVFTSGSSDFASIKYQCTEIEGYSKVLNTSTSNVFHFKLTDEAGQLIELNGGNLVIVILVYRREPLFDMLRQYIKFLLIKDKDENINST